MGLKDDENYIGPAKPCATSVGNSWVLQVCPHGPDFRSLVESGVSWDEHREGDAVQTGRSWSCWVYCAHKGRGWKSARHERGKMLMVIIRE